MKKPVPQPFSVAQHEYANRLDAIFCREFKDELKLEMPGTIGSAKLTFKDENESSRSNTHNSI
jgi:hypothetical protein